MRAKRLAATAWLLLAVAVGQGQQAGTASGAKGGELARHLAMAQQYLSQRKPQQAIPELRAVTALDPANVEARANLGVLLFFDGQFAEAVPLLKGALEAKPDLVKIRALLGVAERRVGDDKSGRANLEAVFPEITEEKLKLDVGRELMDSYTASDELEKAAEVSAVLLKLRPTDPALLYTSYRLHNDLSVQALLELSLTAPNSGQMHQAMAHELQREHDLPGTIRNLRQALALDPKLPGIHFELAEALHASDDQRLRAESVGQYKLAVESSPQDPKAATRMGDVLMESGDASGAEKFYRQALAAQPGFADAEIGLANALMQRGDAAGAAALLQQVEAADPTNSLAHFRLSVVYRKLKRPADVKRELGLYERYKDEHEKLKALYQDMRAAGPQAMAQQASGPAK